MTVQTTPGAATALLTADAIRSAFLAFFEARGHRVVPSSSLVPESDPTLLFANAGMNQFKDTFLGRERRDYVRAASSQKCVRAGGKHNDLENVGLTARHHTFFEMLGNFSFGDYFKKQGIDWAWELLTGELGLPPERLIVTIFRGEGEVPRDAEAHAHWLAHVSADRILELGPKDNFWAMGDTGPCGPCSEIHYFQGDHLPCSEAAAGRSCLGVECECDRWLEVWNLVFMQYDRDAAGTLHPLPAPCVDTGMGLERVAAVVQGQASNYDTDLFGPLLEAIGRRAARPYGASPTDDVALRVVADHVRATTFLISDGVMPGNEGRGYVLRKIMRRAMRFGRRLGLEDPFLHELIGAVVERMAPAFPELREHQSAIARVVLIEEERFASTLRQALGVFEQVAARLDGGGVLAGADAFKLYDTYGLALDLTEDLASDRGLSVDREGFDAELRAQQERARQASKLGAIKGDPVYMKLLEQGTATTFAGYERLELDEARVLAVLRDGQPVPRLDAGEAGHVVLDRTPFYAESGGQVGDHGVLHADGSAARVVDCTLPMPGLHLHSVLVESGGFEAGMRVRAHVDAGRRAGAMRNHTGTHLLHAALREILGPHVKQAGSLVAPDRLRFDFSHYAPVSEREQRHIENRVNEQVLRGSALVTQQMGREEALASGALAFFGDKYGENVRVVEVPGFSREFCGGTHVRQTGEIGLFLLSREQGVASGTRRVEALTGAAALERAREDAGILDELERAAKAERRSLVDEYGRLRDQLKSQQREIQDLKTKLATGAGREGADDAQEIEGVRLWTPRFDDLDREAHRGVVDEFRNRHRDEAFAVLSCASSERGVQVIAAVSDSLKARLGAADWMKQLGLRGGGRPDFAQGGGVEPDGIAELQARAATTLRERLVGGKT